MRYNIRNSEIVLYETPGVHRHKSGKELKGKIFFTSERIIFEPAGFFWLYSAMGRTLELSAVSNFAVHGAELSLAAEKDEDFTLLVDEPRVLGNMVDYLSFKTK